MLSSILGFLFLVFVILITRPITTLIHELGHAIPALLFSNEEVVIYVGSYGDPSKSTILKTGRLTLFFRYKITDWQMGLCAHGYAPGFIRNILIILGGPVFSLLLGLICLYWVKQYADDPYIAFALVALLVSGVSDFIVNMIPNENPLELHNGGMILNDGSQLRSLIKAYKYPPEYSEGMQLLIDKKKEEGVAKLKEVIDGGRFDLDLYRIIMETLEEEPQSAIAFNDNYFEKFKLQSPDYKLLGDIYVKTNESTIALQCYSKAIDLNYKNQNALLERAKLYYKLDFEQKAMDDLKKVILIDESNPEAKQLIQKIKSS